MFKVTSVKANFIVYQFEAGPNERAHNDRSLLVIWLIFEPIILIFEPRLLQII